MTTSIGRMFGAGDARTFMGLPAATPDALNGAKIAIIGAPAATPYASVGAYCAGGPQAIRDAVAGYAANLLHHDFDLGGPIFPDGVVSAADCGDLAWSETSHADNRSAIREAVASIITQGAVPIVLGGDDSIPIPMLEALSGSERYTIVQIDAHIDWRDEVDGERLGLSSTMRRASEMPHIENIIQIGQRSIGSARSSDHDDAKAWGAKFFSARDINDRGLEPALAAIPAGANVIIALDWDALDPSIMPAVIGRAPGGLTYWQTVDLIAGIAAKARIACVDLVEFMPVRDIDETGALTAARVLINVIGLLARQQASA